MFVQYKNASYLVNMFPIAYKLRMLKIYNIKHIHYLMMLNVACTYNVLNFMHTADMIRQVRVIINTFTSFDIFVNPSYTFHSKRRKKKLPLVYSKYRYRSGRVNFGCV